MRLALAPLPALACLVLAAAAPLVGCARRAAGGPPMSGAELARRLDKGDWMVRQGSEVWKVYEAQSVGGQSRPARHIGYLMARDYRQQRGGPAFRIHEVSSLNRKEILGRIDELGRVTRYDPVRNGTFEERTITSSSLEHNVASIFGTTATITLTKTSERHLAFEALDTNHDGLLDAAETEAFGTRLRAADTNGDQKIDFEEFDRVDQL